MYDVVALGEVLIDFTPAGQSEQGNEQFERNPGGAPANVLAALAKLGKKTAFIGKVGKDKFGDFLIDTLNGCGIDTSGVAISGDANTTLAFVHLNSDGDRSFSFYRKPGADRMLGAEEIRYSLLDQARIFHFGSVSMTHEPAATATKKALEYAKAQGLLISFDPNLRIPLWDSIDQAKATIQHGLMYADVVKISEEELEFLTGTTNLSTGSLYLMEQYGMKLLLVTLGEKGCYYARSGGRTGMVPGIRVNAIDTTGAGDAFLGGMLYQLLEVNCELEQIEDEAMQSMLQFANTMGALATTQKGAIPAMPSLDAIREVRG